MKSFTIFAAALTLVIGMTSCNKVEKILPKQDGTWNISSQVSREYENDSLVFTGTETNVGTLFFDKEGTGTFTDADTTTTFTWTVNSDGDQVTICQDFFGIQFCIPNTVVESSKDAQSWSSVIVDGTSRSETDMELERK